VVVAAVFIVLVTVAFAVLEIRGLRRAARAGKGRWALARRWVRVAIACGLALQGVIGGVRVGMGGGLVGFVPSWVLIAGMPWFSPEMILEDEENGLDDDWSLRRRKVDDRMTPLELSLARWRARGMILSGCSPMRLHYAMQFVRETDTDLLEARELIMARGVADSNPDTREIAAFAPIPPFIYEGIYPLGEKVLPFKAGLIAALDDPVREVRGMAAWYLTELGERVVDCAPKMLENMAIPSEGFNWHLIDMTPYAIGRLAVVSDTVWVQLLEASRSSNQELRCQVAVILSDPRLASKGATDRLLELLKGTDRDGIAACYALSRSQDRPDETLAAIVNFIETRRPVELPIYDVFEYKERWWPYLGRLLPFLQGDEGWERRAILGFIEDFPRSSSSELEQALEALRMLAERSVGPDSDAALKLYYKIRYPEGFY
jgi:hypothetical protein